MTRDDYDLLQYLPNRELADLYRMGHYTYLKQSDREYLEGLRQQAHIDKFYHTTWAWREI